MLIIIVVSIVICLLFAQLGCITLWKRYNYFGDGFAHASILCCCINTIMNIGIIYSGIIVALLFSLFVIFFKEKSDNNVVITIISSFMLSLTFILFNIFNINLNMNGVLFGDILIVNHEDLLTLLCTLFTVSLYIFLFYKKILISLFNKDIAYTMGIRVKLLDFIFLVILSISVFLSIKIVGALLVSSMLIIPASAARLIAPSPLFMILYTTIISIFGTLSAFYISLLFDLSVVPMIVMMHISTYVFLFLIVFFFNSLYLKKK